MTFKTLNRPSWFFKQKRVCNFDLIYERVKNVFNFIRRCLKLFHVQIKSISIHF